MSLWDYLIDWLDHPTGLMLGKVEVTRWNVIATTLAIIVSAWLAWSLSWRTGLLVIGGYVLGGVWVFIKRESEGE